MPFTLGFYDLFSFLIPGLFYLYVIYEVFRLLGVDFQVLFPATILSSIPDYGIVAILLVVALIAGNIFDHLARRFVNKLIYRDIMPQTVLTMIKARDSSVNIQFESKDWHLLNVIIRQRSLPVIQTLDKYQADSIMFRNLSLIALSLGLIMIFRAILENNPSLWIAVGVAFLFSIVSAQRSRLFHKWFFEGIFLAALEYGNSVNEVLEQDKTQSLEHSVRFNWSRNKGGKE